MLDYSNGMSILLTLDNSIKSKKMNFKELLF